MFTRFILFAVLASLGMTFATPSLNGPTGLIDMPTADSLRYKEYNVGYDYLVATDDDDEDRHIYKLNLGTFEDWEFGVVGGTVPDEGVFLNLKYHIMDDQQEFPLAVAAGIENLASSENTSVYLVASKTLQGGWHGHFGFRALFADEIDASVMFGAEYFITDMMSVAADITGEDEHYELNVGYRFFMNDQVTWQVSVIDATDNNEYRNGPFVTFGVILTKFL